MSTTAVVTVTLQFAAAGAFVAGGVYFLAGTPDTMGIRVAIGIFAIVCAALLLGLAEVVNILNDIRSAVEEVPAVGVRENKPLLRRVPAAPLETAPEH